MNLNDQEYLNNYVLENLIDLIQNEDKNVFDGLM